MISPAQARDLLNQALSRSQAEHTEASLSGYQAAATRFANSIITQNIAKEDLVLSVRCADGQKVGTASGNDLSPEGIAKTVRRAEEICRNTAPDTEYLPPLPAQTYPEVAVPKTPADTGPQGRADAVGRAVSALGKNGLRLAGSYTQTQQAAALANSNGLFAFWSKPTARLITTVISEDSSGWAEQIAHDPSRIDPEATAKRAREKAIRGKQPRTLEPGDYTVILEPAATADILTYLAWTMQAKPAHEGRRAFSGKEGKTIGSPRVTIRSQPDHPHCPSCPFTEGGLPAPRRTWIEQGRLQQLFYDRFWAQKTERPATGSPTNLILEGNGASPEELVRSTDQGVLVTRFWYIRFVDPMTFTLTGMTRDGLFRIENGRVTHGLKNMRFNVSVLRMLENVEALGEPALHGESIPMWMPALKLRAFPFTSGTLF
jgi:predicted Zn-dependent protease